MMVTLNGVKWGFLDSGVSDNNEALDAYLKGNVKKLYEIFEPFRSFCDEKKVDFEKDEISLD